MEAAKYIFTIAFNENTNLIQQRLWKVIQNDWRFKSLYIKFDIYVRHAVKVTGTIFSLSQVFLLEKTNDQIFFKKQEW